MPLQRRRQGLREHRHPVLVPLPAAHGDLPARQIHVLHPQAQALHQPEPRAVEQRRHQERHTVQHAQDARHLLGREHHREPVPSLRADRMLRQCQRPPQHVPVQEEQRGQRLVLRRRRHPRAHGERGQESLDLGFPQLRRMAATVEDDEAPDPAHVGLLRARAVMSRAKRGPHPIEELRRGRRPTRRYRGSVQHRHSGSLLQPDAPSATSRAAELHEGPFHRRAATISGAGVAETGHACRADPLRTRGSDSCLELPPRASPDCSLPTAASYLPTPASSLPPPGSRISSRTTGSPPPPACSRTRSAARRSWR